MNIFSKGGDGLDGLRDAASALRRWRPAGQTKLRIAREHIERSGDPVRPGPEGPRPGGRLRNLAEASDRGVDDEFVVWDAIHPQPGAGQEGVYFAEPARGRRPVGTPPFTAYRTKKDKKRLRKLERLFPGLRWLFRRLDRLALAGRPWLLGARRIALKHRRKLIWIFVVGVSLAMPSA